MFCRISADRTQGGEMRYCPFRLTPYQLTIKDSDAAEPQPCCLLIAERVHSGYEGSTPFATSFCAEVNLWATVDLRGSQMPHRQSGFDAR